MQYKLIKETTYDRHIFRFKRFSLRLTFHSPMNLKRRWNKYRLVSGYCYSEFRTPLVVIDCWRNFYMLNFMSN